MNPFEAFSSKLIPIDLINIDTNQIIPKQFLKLTYKKTGYDRFLFYDWRYDKDGKPKTDFVPMNNPKYLDRSILLVRDNFGETAVQENMPSGH